MGSEEFIAKAKALVRDYAEEHVDNTDEVPDFSVFVVWSCYILRNQKCLISTTLTDGMYYEVTLNAAKGEMYLDAYKKFENRCIMM